MSHRRLCLGRPRTLAVVVAANLVFTAAVAAVAFYVGWTGLARSLPDLRGWHSDAPESEFGAGDARAGFTLHEYVAQEDRVFAELAALESGPWASATAATFSRYAPGSVCNPARADRNWNRSYISTPPGAAAGALLLHGLSDSPYSFRAIAARLEREGYAVVAPRLPGHGTCPGALAQVSWADWAAAVRVAATGLRDRLPAGAPIVVFGFSNGGALALDYAMSGARHASLPRPGAVVLLSPMVGISPMARAATLYPAVARLSGQRKVAWTRIDPEIDPFKYCSWPVNASLQAWRLTQRVEKSLAALHAAGRAGELPPILALQSVVDSTVRVPDLIARLFDRLPPGRGELVLFDVNRAEWLGNLIDRSFETAITPRLARHDLPFALTLVTNASPGSTELVAHTRRGGHLTTAPLHVSWPRGVFSLSHAAIPVAPDDPILGEAQATAAGGLPLGSLNLRGEHGVLAISESLLFRQRHNPFYAFMEERIVTWLRESLGSTPGAAADETDSAR